MRRVTTIGFWLLTAVLLLSACGASDETSKAPVTPDPEQPTFIFFFTDP
jgi:hypothetical protein